MRRPAVFFRRRIRRGGPWRTLSINPVNPVNPVKNISPCLKSLVGRAARPACSWNTRMDWLKPLIASLLLLAVGLNGLAAWCAWRFRRKHLAPRDELRHRPPATLLVPVRGLEGDDSSHFLRFCQLDWPGYQMIFTVLDPEDGALPALRRLRSTATCQVTLQVGGASQGANPKVRNLLNAWPLVKHDWIVICDADIRPDSDFLAGLLSPFEQTPADREGGIGLVHSLYRCREDLSLAAAWENVWINCDFWSQGLLGERLRGADFAFGAAIALHRDTLARIGGLENIRDYLADDYQLGHRVAGIGRKVVFNRRFVTLQGQAQTWMETWNHLRRWSQTIRVCQPAGHAGSILTNIPLMGLLSLLADPAGFAPWVVLALGLRVTWANQCRNWILDGTGLWRRWWLILFKDLAQVPLWFLAFRNTPIGWRGVRYRVDRGGRLRAL